MSEMPDYQFDSRLLDLHLGHLSESERIELRKEIVGDPTLASQDEALRMVFRALTAASEERMPTDLVARTAARVRMAGSPPRVVRPADALTSLVEQNRNRVFRLGGNLRDIVAVAAMIVLAVGLGVPGMLHLRDRQQRLGCSFNLAQLGTGLQQYASAFGGSLPFAGWTSGDSWQASSDARLVNVPNRRHVYPLLRLNIVPNPRLFICPSQQHMPMPIAEIQRHSDFLEARNVSYSYQNMAGRRPTAYDDPRMPILADENPLFADGVPLFDARRFAVSNPALANSRAHAGGGQNVLTIRGEVRWTTTPAAGIDDDNIWTLKGVTDYTGREGPLSATDCHLLK